MLDNPTIHADGPGTVTAYDPSTGFKIGTFPSPTPQDMYDLVTHAERASYDWKQTTFAQRRRVLRSLLDWIIRDKRAIAEICCRDTGKTSEFRTIVCTVRLLSHDTGQCSMAPSERFL